MHRFVEMQKANTTEPSYVLLYQLVLQISMSVWRTVYVPRTALILLEGSCAAVRKAIILLMKNCVEVIISYESVGLS